eukprot:Amastigsp_a842982_57.p3 type:complete len:167 gc:universal Amastigsp_a842982_57:1-501(+)
MGAVGLQLRRRRCSRRSLLACSERGKVGPDGLLYHGREHKPRGCVLVCLARFLRAEKTQRRGPHQHLGPVSRELGNAHVRLRKDFGPLKDGRRPSVGGDKLVDQPDAERLVCAEQRAEHERALGGLLPDDCGVVRGEPRWRHDPELGFVESDRELACAHHAQIARN